MDQVSKRDKPLCSIEGVQCKINCCLKKPSSIGKDDDLDGAAGRETINVDKRDDEKRNQLFCCFK